MFDENKSTVSQGTVGLTAAIFQYTTLGYRVLLPLVDNQSYDLVIEKDGLFLTVQCKTTKQQPFKTNYNYFVELKSVRSNRTENKIIPLSECDLVFVLCSDGTSYSIPFTKIQGKNGVSLNGEFEDFKLGVYRPMVGNQF